MPVSMFDYADQIAEQVGFFSLGLDPELRDRIMEFGAACAERAYASGYAAGSAD